MRVAPVCCRSSELVSWQLREARTRGNIKETLASTRDTSRLGLTRGGGCRVEQPLERLTAAPPPHGQSCHALRYARTSLASNIPLDSKKTRQARASIKQALQNGRSAKARGFDMSMKHGMAWHEAAGDQGSVLVGLRRVPRAPLTKRHAPRAMNPRPANTSRHWWPSRSRAILQLMVNAAMVRLRHGTDQPLSSDQLSDTVGHSRWAH